MKTLFAERLSADLHRPQELKIHLHLERIEYETEEMARINGR